MTEVTKPQKFLFDLAFDDLVGGKREEQEKPSYSQEQLDEAKRESHEAGLIAGRKEEKEAQQQKAGLLLEDIGKKLDSLTKASTEEWQKQVEHLQQIALVIAHKILPAYVEKYGVDEIETLVSRVVSEMVREPRLVIRVSEDQFDEAKKRIDALTQSHAFAGEIVILGDPTLGRSDCRVEWANGGVERDVKSLWQEIDRVLETIQGTSLSCLLQEEKKVAPPEEAAPPEAESHDPPTGEQT